MKYKAKQIQTTLEKSCPKHKRKLKESLSIQKAIKIEEKKTKKKTPKKSRKILPWYPVNKMYLMTKNKNEKQYWKT